MSSLTTSFNTVNMALQPAEAVSRLVADVMREANRGLTARQFDEEVGYGWILPPEDTYAQRYNTAYKYYRSYFDEALRDDWQNALAMRRDGVCEELIFGRKMPVVSLDHHLDHDDPEDEEQKKVCNQVEKVIATVPRWHFLKMYLLETPFFGKYGSQVVYGNVSVSGRKYVNIVKHTPVQGDKIAWKWDGTPGVFVSKSGDIFNQRPDMLKYVEPGDRGSVFWLHDKHYREKFIIHEGESFDGDFLFEGDLSGGVHGIGWRSRYYWLWNMRTELFGWVLDALQRIGTNGNTVGIYPLGNDAAEKAIKDMLRTLTRDQYATVGVSKELDIDNIIKNYPVNAVGYDILLRIVEYLDAILRRGVLGQNLSSESAATGLGSGVADFQKDTKNDITKLDAKALDETFDRDYLKVMLKYNVWEYRGKMVRGDQLPFSMKWSSQIEEKDAKDQMEAAKSIHDMGGSLDVEDLRDKGGLATPKDPANTLPGAPQGQNGAGGPGGGQPGRSGMALNGSQTQPGGMGGPNGHGSRGGQPRTNGATRPTGQEFARQRAMEFSRHERDGWVDEEDGPELYGEGGENCGDGAGGFQPGNTCAGGGNGQNGSGPVPLVMDQEIGKSDFESRALSEEESTEAISRIRGGDERSKNKGSVTPEYHVGRLVLVRLPLSVFDSDYREFIEDSTDKERVNRYKNEKVNTPIYSMPRRKGNGWQLSDGGHRMMAAIARGDTHINSYVPVTSYEKLMDHVRSNPESDIQNQSDHYARGQDRSADPGVMIACMVPSGLADRLALPDGEDPNELHMTLCYIGRLSELSSLSSSLGSPSEATQTIREIVTLVAQYFPPLEGRISGVGRFAASPHSDNQDVIYASVDIPGLAEFRAELVKVLRMADIPYSEDFTYTPHITLKYVDPTDRRMVMVGEYPVKFDSLALVIGYNKEFFYFNEPDQGYITDGLFFGGDDPERYGDGGENCGTGDGGFQSGNTCAKGGKGGTTSTVKKKLKGKPSQSIGDRIKADTASAAIVGKLSEMNDWSHVALKRRYQEANREYQLTVDKINKSGDSASDDLIFKYRKLRSKVDETKKSYIKSMSNFRSTVSDLISASNPVAVEFTRPKRNWEGKELTPLDYEMESKVDKATRWLSGIIEKGRWPETFDTPISRVPDGSPKRSHCSEQGEVCISSFDDDSTVVHEFGHAMEFRYRSDNTRVLDSCFEFLEYRVGDESSVQINKLFPHSGYSDKEMGRKDRFDEAFPGQQAYYIGKDYGKRATEILSMGLEKLYTDPTGFAANDPEYCQFVIGILKGTI